MFDIGIVEGESVNCVLFGASVGTAAGDEVGDSVGDVVGNKERVLIGVKSEKSVKLLENQLGIHLATQ